MSCGKPIAHLYGPFKEKVIAGETEKQAMDDLKVVRFCCRAQFMGHVDLLEEISRFKKG
jgi:DNA-directed RNA polymerase subunit N